MNLLYYHKHPLSNDFAAIREKNVSEFRGAARGVWRDPLRRADSARTLTTGDLGLDDVGPRDEDAADDDEEADEREAPHAQHHHKGAPLAVVAVVAVAAHGRRVLRPLGPRRRRERAPFVEHALRRLVIKCYFLGFPDSSY